MEWRYVVFFMPLVLGWIWFVLGLALIINAALGGV